MSGLPHAPCVENAMTDAMSESLFAAGIRVSVILLWSAASVSAQQLGTAEQARAMLDRAVSALKSNASTALSEFNDPNNKQFHDRDLYVFCYNLSDAKITAYESPALLNIDVRTLALKDDPIGKRAYEAVQNSPEGSVTTIDYNFPKPGTTEQAPKQTLETRIGSQGCGRHILQIAARTVTNRHSAMSASHPFGSQ
jgi:cytochrome c